MLADIVAVLQMMVHVGFPKRNNKPVIFDQIIKGWYFGDRTIIAETPAILFQGQAGKSIDVAFGTRELTHNISVSCWSRSDDNALTEQQVLEFTRLLYEIFLPHRRIWVLAKCPFCSADNRGSLTKRALSPQHLILSHSGILGSFDDEYISGDPNNSYVAQAKNEINSKWLQTHTSGYSGWDNDKSGLASKAFNFLYENVRSGYGNVSGTQLSNLQTYQSQFMRPIRLLYDCVFSEINPVKADNDKGLFRGGEFIFTAKELIKVTEFGPDNVSTDVWG